MRWQQSLMWAFPIIGSSRWGCARQALLSCSSLDLPNWKWNFAYIESDFRWKWENYLDSRDLEAKLLWVIFSPWLCRAGPCDSFLSPWKLLSVQQGWGWWTSLDEPYSLCHTLFQISQLMYGGYITFDTRRNGAIPSGADVIVNALRCQVPLRVVEFVMEKRCFYVK